MSLLAVKDQGCDLYEIKPLREITFMVVALFRITMAADDNRQPASPISSIETQIASVPQVDRSSSLPRNRPMSAVAVNFENGAAVKFVGGGDELYSEYYHPKSPDETTVLFEHVGEPRSIEVRALNWIAKYKRISEASELYDEFDEQRANVLLGREFRTALDIFDSETTSTAGD